MKARRCRQRDVTGRLLECKGIRMVLPIAEIIVGQQGEAPHRGFLIAGGRTLPCSLGRSGLSGDKREGDGATPLGRFPLRRVLYRADRLARPSTSLPTTALAPEDGWCESASHPAYNRQVKLPHEAAAESLWRSDHLYDILVVLGYNDDPVTPGRGSAIFFHLARLDYGPTRGCVAIALADMIDVLSRCTVATVMSIKSR
jgi:L,D-peptidoglycan transpeptidase YkuD (ErfK/YbiS/YcfS/YnhG family)